MYWVRRGSVLFALLLVISFAAWFVPRALDPTDPGPEKRDRDRRWVNTSPYFWDRQACRWMSICGLHHLRKDPASRGNEDFDEDDGEDDGRRIELRRRSPGSWDNAELPRVDKKRNVNERRRILKDIPDYVYKHAPLVHLYSGEEFWPSDIKEHVEHMTVYVNEEPLNSTENEWTLNNLDQLNEYQKKVILRSNDDVESRPNWLHSHYNVPSPFDDDETSGDDDQFWSPSDDPQRGPTSHREPTTWWDVDKQHPLHRISDPRRKSGRRGKSGSPRLMARGHKPDDDGYSGAPAVLVVVDKGSGILDAFWFFFYSYNLGQTVLGIRFGNHVGDWEHCMVRFEHGQPRGMYLSEHDGGQAYAWQAMEKRGDRPVIYSAVGSHAMYSLPGDHPYILPFELLKDVTDKGPLWDPALNNYAYHYDYTLEDVDDIEDPDAEPDITTSGDSLVPASKNPQAPTSWFHFAGHWGDDIYSLADPRQWRFFGQYHYVKGPFGPKFKYLARPKMCQLDTCRILYKLDPKGTWY